MTMDLLNFISKIPGRCILGPKFEALSRDENVQFIEFDGAG